jgi:hypothetical protein
MVTPAMTRVLHDTNMPVMALLFEAVGLIWHRHGWQCGRFTPVLVVPVSIYRNQSVPVCDSQREPGYSRRNSLLSLSQLRHKTALPCKFLFFILLAPI